MVVSDGLKEIDQHDATPATGTKSFGDQPVAVEPASSVGGPDAEHPDRIGNGEQRPGRGASRASSRVACRGGALGLVQPLPGDVGFDVGGCLHATTTQLAGM
jgi:hypothetical protein